MLDYTMIDNIRESGLVQGQSEVDARMDLLKDLGFEVKSKAEYAMLASCFLPTLVSEDMRAFAHLLKHFGVDHALLPKEHCCGNLILRQATKGGSSGAEQMAEAEGIVNEFVMANLQQVRSLGAKKIITFCVSCDAVYRRMDIAEEVVWFPTLLGQLFEAGKLPMQVDYYEGCQFYYKKMGLMPDLKSATALLDRIEGLEVNEIDSRFCCTRPDQLDALLASVRSRIMVTVCAGCVAFLQPALQSKGDHRVVMLPQLVWAAVNGHSL